MLRTPRAAQRRGGAGIAIIVVGLLACSCSSVLRAGSGSTNSTKSSAVSPATRSASQPPSRGSSPAAASSAVPGGVSDAAYRTLEQMTLQQRVGQLLMVGTDSTQLDSDASAALRNLDAGAVILMGNSTLSVAQTRNFTASIDSDAQGPGLFIATDQEGGEVRRLRGSGFSDMPSALQQSNVVPQTLQTQATYWGKQLRAAGINVDLAPVADTIDDAAAAADNPPIGGFDREYGFGSAVVAAHALAFSNGLQAAGIDATAKHFPGLGRVSENTDTSSGVTDTVTTANDSSLQPFGALIGGGVRFVMMSTAIYSKIDPGVPAAFSSKIVTTLLRQELGFSGVIISDDLGGARQVAGYPPGKRAVSFIEAGGDMVLTVDASQASAMASAMISRAEGDPSFEAQVDAAALVVLQAKNDLGLLK